jgi:hypothetical protein
VENLPPLIDTGKARDKAGESVARLGQDGDTCPPHIHPRKRAIERLVYGLMIGQSTRSLPDAVRVCKAVESSLRREQLDFHHHKVVANDPDAQALLEWAVENDATVKELRDRWTPYPSPNKKAPPGEPCAAAGRPNEQSFVEP